MLRALINSSSSDKMAVSSSAPDDIPYSQPTDIAPPVVAEPGPPPRHPLAAEVDKTQIRSQLDLVDDLRRLGLEQDLPIPQIAVMGDQSSGKSSVLEALSGIPFPRGSGLVTRAACLLSMKTAPDFAASVTVRKHPSHNMPTNGLLQSIPIAVDSVDKIGQTIASLSKDLTSSLSIPFSPHTIEVNLASSNSPQLTLVDLPGIVRTTTNVSSKEAIPLVDALLARYLKQERTVILAVIPANVDIATVDILERAAHVDPSGQRTLGVLTKVDLINPGGEQEVIEVLLNRRKPLRLGYLAVRNRTQTELNQLSSHGSLLDLESRFFASHPEFGRMDSRLLGAENLARRLSDVLVDRIEGAMGPIVREIEEKLGQAKEDLRLLGEPVPDKPGAIRFAFLRILDAVTRNVESIAGSGSAPSSAAIDASVAPFKSSPANLWRGCRQAFEALESDIQKTSPGSETGPDAFRGRILDPGRSMSCNNIKHDKLDGREFNFEETGRFPPAVLDDILVRKVMLTGDACSRCKEGGHESKVQVVSVSRPFRQLVAQKMSERRGRELPGFMNFDSFSYVFGGYVARWQAPTISCVETVVDLLRTIIEEMLRPTTNGFNSSDGVAEHEPLVTGSGSGLSTGSLHKGTSGSSEEWERFPVLISEMSLSAREAIRDLDRECRQQIESLLDEERTPYTQNQHLMDTLNKIRMDRLIAALDCTTTPGWHDVNEQRGSNNRDQKEDPVRQSIIKWYNANHHIGAPESSSDSKDTSSAEVATQSQEVQDMVDILETYWKLAMKRYVDNVAMAIDRLVVRAFPSKLKLALLQLSDSDERLKRLMPVSAAELRQRKYLEDKIARLTKAQERLRLL